MLYSIICPPTEEETEVFEKQLQYILSLKEEPVTTKEALSALSLLRTDDSLLPFILVQAAALIITWLVSLI